MLHRADLIESCVEFSVLTGILFTVNNSKVSVHIFAVTLWATSNWLPFNAVENDIPSALKSVCLLHSQPSCQLSSSSESLLRFSPLLDEQASKTVSGCFALSGRSAVFGSKSPRHSRSPSSQSPGSLQCDTTGSSA
jgi:hypothetical protein